MYSNLYNRLLGWLSLALLGTGLTGHGLGTYLSFNTSENVSNLTVGAITLFAARRRKRYATALALLLGILYLGWGVTAMFGVKSPVGTADPLDNLIRSLIGIWGIYVSAHDVLTWRREQLAT